MTRTLFTAIFLTLFSQTAWANVSTCIVDSEFRNHNCQDGDHLRYVTQSSEFSFLEEAAYRYCDLDKEVIMTVRQPTKTKSAGNLICVFQNKVPRPE